MRRVENIAIAVCMVAITGLLVALVVLTNQVKTQLSTQQHYSVNPEVDRLIERQLYENQVKIDSVRTDTTLSIHDAARKLQERYRRR